MASRAQIGFGVYAKWGLPKTEANKPSLPNADAVRSEVPAAWAATAARACAVSSARTGPRLANAAASEAPAEDAGEADAAEGSPANEALSTAAVRRASDSMVYADTSAVELRAIAWSTSSFAESKTKSTFLVTRTTRHEHNNRCICSLFIRSFVRASIIL